jgi:SAM-dependent methyltransferase
MIAAPPFKASVLHGVIGDRAMGSGEAQGQIWGARAADWVAQEASWRPVFEAALDNSGLRSGEGLLDVGCGAGGLLVAARGRGAEVAGLDASANLVAIARDRVPGARIEVGDMEQLPFPDAAFDVVTGINAFQFAADHVRALVEARRVCRPGGRVLMLVWGPRAECQLISLTLPAVFALLPPSPPGPPPPAFAEAGVIEGLMRAADLRPAEAGTFTADLVFPDAAAAVRGVASAMARAIAHAGEERVFDAIRASLPAVTRADGSVAWTNRFRWVRMTR